MFHSCREGISNKTSKRNVYIHNELFNIIYKRSEYSSWRSITMSFEVLNSYLEECWQIQRSILRSIEPKIQEHHTQPSLSLPTFIAGEKDLNSIESMYEFITHPKKLPISLSNYVHASAGAGVQPVATSDVFCTELYFFVMNLRYYIEQFDHYLFCSYWIC